MKEGTPAMSHPLSKKQLEVLKALEGFARARGHIPSVRELAGRLRKSPTTVFQHLKALERRGYLKGDGSAHGWILLQRSESRPALPAMPTLSVLPTSGSGAAVQPALAALETVAVADEMRDVPEEWVRVRISGSIAAGAPIEADEDTKASRACQAAV